MNMYIYISYYAPQEYVSVAEGMPLPHGGGGGRSGKRGGGAYDGHRVAASTPPPQASRYIPGSSP